MQSNLTTAPVYKPSPERQEYLENANWVQLSVERTHVAKLVSKFTGVYSGPKAAKYDAFDAPHREAYQAELNYLTALIKRRFPNVNQYGHIAAVLESELA